MGGSDVALAGRVLWDILIANLVYDLNTGDLPPVACPHLKPIAEAIVAPSHVLEIQQLQLLAGD